MPPTTGHHPHPHLLFLPLLLFLLLHLPLSFPLSCETSISHTDCDSLPFVPGHELVGEGFNVVTMKSTGAFVIDTQTYMADGERGNCTVCRNLLLGRVQKLPVSVADWRVRVRCRRTLSAQTYMSSQAVLKRNAQLSSSSWKAGLNLRGMQGLAVGGTQSKSSRFAKSRSARDKYAYSRHEFTCRYYTLRLQAHPPVTREFQRAVRSLPVKYNSTTLPAYRRFISIYGTHFLQQVDLGGRAQSTTAVRMCQLSLNGLSVQDVSICLSVEGSATIGGLMPSAATHFCKAKGKKLKWSRSFASAFSERITDVLGGRGGRGRDLLFTHGKKFRYDAWLRSLKALPGVVSHRLASLHKLLDRKDAEKRQSLRTAISDYIRAYAVPVACRSRCKVGRRTQSCLCKCSGHRGIDANCCPTQSSLASLTVVVEKATGLWGDYLSKTDAYVKVFYGKRGSSTAVIRNNDFPQWNYRISFGTVDLGRRVPLRFQVWDRDQLWNDDLLGAGSLVPSQARRVRKRFPLKHGSLYVSITAICAPNLSGALCQRYTPTPQAEGGQCSPDQPPGSGLTWDQAPRTHAWRNASL